MDQVEIFEGGSRGSVKSQMNEWLRKTGVTTKGLSISTYSNRAGVWYVMAVSYDAGPAPNKTTRP